MSIGLGVKNNNPLTLCYDGGETLESLGIFRFDELWRLLCYCMQMSG